MPNEGFIIKTEELVLLKQTVARLLCGSGIEQSKVARIMKVTQPTISNYISSRNKIPREIEEYAHAMVKKILNGSELGFYSYVSFSEKEHRGRCFIADENELITDEKQEIIDNLTSAFQLLKGLDINLLKPQVKMNMAMSKNNPRTINDIASFVNGFLLFDNRISSISSIRFGGSKHLASLLLYLKDKDANVNSIMNVKFNKSIKKSKFRCAHLTRDYKLVDDGEYDVLLHEGDFGIEPCAYVLGSDAKDVARKVISISEVIG